MDFHHGQWLRSILKHAGLFTVKCYNSSYFSIFSLIAFSIFSSQRLELSLPREIREITKLGTFKSKLYHFLTLDIFSHYIFYIISIFNFFEIVIKIIMMTQKEKWSRDGAVAEHLPPMQASHQCGLGLIPELGVICGLSLLLVLVLAPRGFSPGTRRKTSRCKEQPT